MDYGLKKYVIKQAFSSYKEGAVVAFNDNDAAFFKDKIKPFEEKALKLKKK